MQVTCVNCHHTFEIKLDRQQATTFAYCPKCYFQNALPAQQQPEAYLQTHMMGGQVQDYPLGPINTIGRHPDNTIQIIDKMISKHHSRIIRKNNKYYVEDLQSRNGTFLNGYRITSAELNHEDEIQIGTVKFIFISPQNSHQMMERQPPTSHPSQPTPQYRPPTPPPNPSQSFHQQLQNPPQKSRSFGNVTIVGTNDFNPQVTHIRHDMENAKDFLPIDQITNDEILRRDYEKLRIAHELNRRIGLQLDQNALFEQILEETFKLVPAERGIILILNDNNEWEPVSVKKNVNSKHQGEDIQISRTILQTTVENKEAILSSDLMLDKRFSKAKSVISQQIRSSMSLPLISRADNEILGIIYLDTQNARGVFTEKDLQLMSVVATQAANALDNSRMAAKIQRESLVKNYLQRFLPPAVMQRLTEDDLSIHMGGEMVEATMMFTDIRGFTSLSENYNPQELIQELNTYFSLLVDIIFQYEGTLDKFIGDAVMAVWGTPEQHPDDPKHAVRAAVKIQRELQGLNARRIAQGLPPFFTGIGINTDRVVAGNMGSIKRMEFTIIGDGVNLASRLCSQAKANEIIISESTFQQVKDYFVCTALPPAKVKGKSEPVPIYRVEGEIMELGDFDVETGEIPNVPKKNI